MTVTLSGNPAAYEGFLVKDAAPGSQGIYLVHRGERWLFPDLATYVDLVGSAQPTPVLNIDFIPEKGAFDVGARRVKVDKKDAQYLISNKVKKLISSLKALEKYHFAGGKLYPIDQIVLDAIPSGPGFDA